MKNLKAVIVKGNPLYINTPHAIKYYNDIAAFIKSCGVKNVSFDPGDDMTSPDLTADFYVGHSRGCNRARWLPPEKQKVFLLFGVPRGIIHPVDLEWCNKVYVPGTIQQPPKEHFIFIKEQKDAIVSLIENLRSVYQEEDSVLERDGKVYDLNFFFRITHNSPVLTIDVNKLKWVLKYLTYTTDNHKKRIEHADISVPVLVTKYENKELVVDGFHRLTKAVQMNIKRLPYRRISEEDFEKGYISTSEEYIKKNFSTSLESRKGFFNW